MSRILATVLALFAIANSSQLFAQAPANDNCGAAVLLTAATPAAGTVWNATASSVTAGCAVGNPDDDVWFRFVATSSLTATITLSSIGTNLNSSGAMVQIYSGTCPGSLVSVSCGNGSLTPLVVNGLINGNTYYVRVYSYATGALPGVAAGSAFTITFTTNVVPSNDECTNAIYLPVSNTSLKSNGWLKGATTSATTPVCGGTVKYDVWYYFVANNTSQDVTISSAGSNISGNVMLQVLSGTCGGSLSTVACGASPINATGLTIGTPYLVRVYSNTGIATTFTSNAGFNIAITNPVAASVTDSTSSLFNMDVVAKNLGYPWEITYGPDDSLWITEAKGYRVLRISASRTASDANTAAQQVLKIPLNSSLVNFGRGQEDIDPGSGVTGRWPQGGMQGLAIHPEFETNSSKRWIYLSYVYKVGTCANSNTTCEYRTKIVRCRFYFSADVGNPSLRLPKADTLTIMDTVISNLSGSNDHNSGRLKVGPTLEGPDNTYKLYYTIGDMGAGQFNNAGRTNYAQNPDTAEGKVLRLNTEPDADGVPGTPVHEYDKWREWIPNDNPFTHSVLTSVRTPIYSYGHRNAQGLSWGKVNGTWRLYSSEHGDMAGDEVNIIQSGQNYGWPRVTGAADNNYTTSDNINNGFTQNDILANLSITDETTFSSHTSNFKKPVFDFFNWTASQMQTINTGNIYTWPTIAPSGIEFYSGNIPGWKNSLLVTSLKYGMYRLKLNSNGDGVDSTASSTNVTDTFPLLHTWRIRDMAINPLPNSGQFWAITDSSGATSGPTGGFSGGNQSTQDPGRVLRLTYKTTINSLPVHFISFTGKLLTDNTIRLDWKAETDREHHYFDVEKSIDNNSFVPIGRVTGGPPYFLIDPSPNTGNNYYRIKAVDYDGTTTYTKVINVVYDPSKYAISIFPNPMREKLNIKILSPKSGPIQLRVTDMQGRVVYQDSRFINEGSTAIQLDVKKWPTQLYSVRIMTSDNIILTTQKLMKL